MVVIENSLITWLADAHAMEQAAIGILEMQSKRLAHYPRIEAKVIEHLEVTRQQAKRVESCLRRYNAQSSDVKDFMGRYAGVMNAVMLSAAVGDEAIKASIANYAFENMEIGTYQVLIATASYAGDDETRTICEEILGQEKEMANWLAKEMANTTRMWLNANASETESPR